MYWIAKELGNIETGFTVKLLAKTPVLAAANAHHKRLYDNGNNGVCVVWGVDAETARERAGMVYARKITSRQAQSKSFA